MTNVRHLETQQKFLSKGIAALSHCRATVIFCVSEVFVYFPLERLDGSCELFRRDLLCTEVLTHVEEVKVRFVEGGAMKTRPQMCLHQVQQYRTFLVAQLSFLIRLHVRALLVLALEGLALTIQRLVAYHPLHLLSPLHLTHFQCTHFVNVPIADIFKF